MILSTAEFLLPRKGVDMSKWAAIACDQFTSDRAYWDKLDAYVGDAPSTLRLILPEVYLGDGDGENLVRHPKGNEEAVPEGDVAGEFLGERAGHEAIAQVDDQLGGGHGQERAAGLDDGEPGELAGAREVAAREREGLEGIEPDRAGLNAKGEADGKISQRDGQPVPQPGAKTVVIQNDPFPLPPLGAIQGTL